MGSAIKDTFKETNTASIGTLPLNAVVMQDDNAILNDNLSQARTGCSKIHDTLMRKQLSVNHTKCKFLIVGPKRFRDAALREIKIKPMKMGGLIKQ